MESSISKDEEFDSQTLPMITDTETPLPIGIIGAGISGIALAISLQRKGLRSMIFEKDNGFHSRNQGYGLTLQQGGKAFKKLNLLDTVQSKCVLSNCHYIFNNKGELILGFGSFEPINNDSTWESKYICHIARQDLRECFIDQLDPEYVTVHWESEFISYSEGISGVYINIKNKTDPFLVRCIAGCDGINSLVRQSLLPNLSLNFLNTFVMLGIVDSNTTFDHRVTQMSDGKTRIFCMPFNKKQMMWQLSFPIKTSFRLDKKELKELAIERCKFFHATLLNMLKDTVEDNITGYPVYDRDPIQSADFPINVKVTLLGDAAHPMSPFKGQGANQALLDAMYFTECLVKQLTVQDAIHEYQVQMVKRTNSKVLGSREAVELLHTSEFVDTEYQLRRMHYADLDEHLKMYKDIKDQNIGIWNIERIDRYLKDRLG